MAVESWFGGTLHTGGPLDWTQWSLGGLTVVPGLPLADRLQVHDFPPVVRAFLFTHHQHCPIQHCTTPALSLLLSTRPVKHGLFPHLLVTQQCSSPRYLHRVSENLESRIVGHPSRALSCQTLYIATIWINDSHHTAFRERRTAL
jgi:hypothetical protein